MLLLALGPYCKPGLNYCGFSLLDGNRADIKLMKGKLIAVGVPADQVDEALVRNVLWYCKQVPVFPPGGIRTTVVPYMNCTIGCTDGGQGKSDFCTPVGSA